MTEFAVPESCTLPSAEQPVRVREIEALCASALVGRERVDDRHLRLMFEGGDAVAAWVEDFAVREGRCCSFFEFAITAGEDQVVLHVAVPPTRVEVLDGLERLADHATRGCRPVNDHGLRIGQLAQAGGA